MKKTFCVINYIKRVKYIFKSRKLMKIPWIQLKSVTNSLKIKNTKICKM